MGRGEPRILGQDLRRELRVHQDHTSWLKAQIERAQFIENEDFTVFTELSENPRGGRPATDYLFVLPG